MKNTYSFVMHSVVKFNEYSKSECNKKLFLSKLAITILREDYRQGF